MRTNLETNETYIKAALRKKRYLKMLLKEEVKAREEDRKREKNVQRS